MDLGTGLTPTRLVTGQYATCAFLEPASGAAAAGPPVVKCWGSADGGQLGTGDEERRGDGPDEMVGARVEGSTHCAELELCVLTRTRTTPTTHPTITTQAPNHHPTQPPPTQPPPPPQPPTTAPPNHQPPHSQGDNLPALDLGSGLVPLDLALGLGHGCAVLANTSAPAASQRLVKCWCVAAFACVHACVRACVRACVLARVLKGGCIVCVCVCVCVSVCGCVWVCVGVWVCVWAQATSAREFCQGTRTPVCM
mgnify:CR=1 FL=1